ncbi:hypothetical protein GALL_253870 [mine drainage metagenome]|uniref:(S)-ureidoglycine aminohydrolase cupin domain-containing protein n=1 Tax=mine drainage metagenome TaxID=410659 RepID=A0A1J5RA18_9ZZZZ
MQDFPPLPPDSAVDASRVELAMHELPAAQIVSGQPRTGAAELGTLGGCAVGVWEITPGVSTDVEADELFVVLSGRAVVEFDDGSTPLQLQPGSVARLRGGSHTRWTVSETLRKVYIVESNGS